MESPERVAEATRSFLEDHPDAESNLEDLVAIDERGPWTFDDAPLDSGRFGEMVSRDIARKTDDGDYRLADRDATLTVIESEAGTDTVAPDTASTDESALGSNTSTADRELLTLPSIDGRAALGLVAALAVVAAARLVGYASVFRNGDVVSPGNDPYYYRYWQRHLLAESNGPLDASVLSKISGGAEIRPLTHATNWWITELLGGSSGTADAVAAWLPIVLTLLLAIAVYRLATLLTGDVRIGLASVLLLGVAPVHAVYTSAGFLEHRAHQYFWLGVLTLALTWLAVDLHRRLRGPAASAERSSSGTPNDRATAAAENEATGYANLGDDAAVSRAMSAHVRARRSWAVAAILAVAVAASVHAWGGSSLVFFPVATYVALRAAADANAGLSPARTLAPTVGGLGGGAVLAAAAHLRWGWHDAFVAFTPALVVLGGVTVIGLAELWRRFDLPIPGLIGAEALVAVGGAFGYRSLRPDDVDRIRERMDALFFRESATETASLFAPEQAFVFGPLTQLGLGFFLAVIPLGLATWIVVRRYEPGWLVPVCFTWWFLVFAAIQVRFAGQLAIFVALFGAIALVYLLSAIDLVRRPTPFDGAERSPDGASIELPEQKMAIGYTVGILCLVLVFNLIFVPGLIGELTYDDGQYGASQAIEQYDERLDHEYPGNFVLSQWGHNRMYNFFVNGEASSYAYAQNNYESFLSASDPDTQYDQLRNRVGYVVLEDQDSAEGTVHHTLYEEYGAGDQPTAHYQLIYAEHDTRAFAVVEGATIQTNAAANATITASTNVTVDDAAFTYERTATANATGIATLRVAYPGEYTVGNETVTVSQSDVHEGRTVSAAS
ncbi:hypothetical protein GCM10028857_29130 [Salinarchaeum chitinilyticum]